ncbi:hypothetical protein OG292_23955 [Streptomyces sp. NBC_01511]|uniref:hypothetical protein n=1 Tax=Streptomyces sp. NBC_01511 TaxID=2903889 RepID=UPI0038696047
MSDVGTSTSDVGATASDVGTPASGIGTRATGTRRTWLSPRGLDPAARRAFGDMIPYCLPGVAQHVVTAGAKPAVLYTATDAEHGDRVDLLLEEALRRTAGPRSTTDRSPDPDGAGTNVLLDQWELPGPSREPYRPDLRAVGEGLFVAGPGLARLAAALEGAVLGLASEVAAADFLVPHLVSWPTLERAGYAHNFPQHVTACQVVGPDLDALDRFAAATDRETRAAELRTADVCVSPAVCLHLFAGLADSTLPEPFVATARGACGRYEAGAAGASTRLWSFSMRELVYVGDREGAERFRDTMLVRLSELARSLALPCRIESATDPFFTSDRSDMTGFQEKFEVKYELRGRLADDGSAVAVSSLNCHDQHFGAAFGIRLPDGSPAHSVCVGFGLDRWAQWLYGWLGDDPESWPEPLRGAVHRPDTRPDTRPDIRPGTLPGTQEAP